MSMDKASPKAPDWAEHRRSLGSAPHSSDPSDDPGTDDQGIVGSSADPGQDEAFARAVEQHLRRLAHDHMIDEIAVAARREPRGLKGARRQFRRIGLPRCIACHRLVLPWQLWVAEWEEWPQHHACYHLGLARYEKEAAADQAASHRNYIRSYERCRFCGWRPEIAAAAFAAGVSPGDQAAVLAERLTAEMSVYAAQDWLAAKNLALAGRSPLAALRAGQRTAVEQLVVQLENDSFS